MLRKNRLWMASLGCRAILLLTILLIFFLPAALAQDESPLILVMQADGPVAPTMQDYLARGIRTAERRGAEAVVFELNTPGGAVVVMNYMVEMLLASQVPVVVYVSPQGAMAASAGTVITLAGHASAMAPGTIIGAASPVGSQGEDLDQTMQAKEKEAIKASVRTLTERRPAQAVSLAEQTIDNAKAVSAREAYQVGLVDFLASDVDDLLRQLDGFTVQVNGAEKTLHTANARVEALPPSLIESLLAILTNPNIVFLLLNIGVLAILIEISSPGGWVAGFIGVVCLALATYGLGVLPVNWFGLVFLVMAFVLFFLDIKAPTHGALTVAGAASLIVSALVLFNSPGVPVSLRVSPWLIVIVSLLTAAGFGLLVAFVVRVRNLPVWVGTEGVVGRVGMVRNPLAPRGTVSVGSELWTAELIPGEEPLPKGARVEVVQVDGFKLYVRKAS
jgi:membrane-bound serine protease (ClpP class)